MLGITLAKHSQQGIEKKELEWFSKRRDLNEFSLQSVNREFNKQSLIGQWTIVLFGFMQCPDVCPTALSKLAALSERLGDETIRYVFVSVDPKRDSPEQLSRYVGYFDSSIVGVTGEAQQLRYFSKGLGVQFKVAVGSKDYAVAHSTYFSVIGPDGSFRGRFLSGFDALNLAAELKAKLKGV